MFVRCCQGNSRHPPKYRFGPCVLPIGSDSFSHVIELQPLRRFTLRSPCRTHPSGRIRRIPNVSALSQGLHTFRLLGTHASVGSMGNESHGYFTFPFFTFLLIAFMSHFFVRCRSLRTLRGMFRSRYREVRIRFQYIPYGFH